MTRYAGLTRLRGELGLHEGRVPDALGKVLASTPVYQISGEAFLLSLPMGLVFHYRRGAGTAFRRSPGVTDDEVALFFEGSVYGAIAWLNGYVPLHASAVLHEEQVYAFTGPSGEGKSTLASALGQRGMTLCSDDVLVLDLSDPGQVIALPGPARMKLWDDALALTGRSSSHAVRAGVAKYYVSDLPFAGTSPLPVRKLYFLESDAESPPSIIAISGSAAFNWVRSAYYRPRLFKALAGQDRHFETGVRLGRSLALARFSRRRERTEFDAAVDVIAADIRAAA